MKALVPYEEAAPSAARKPVKPRRTATSVLQYASGDVAAEVWVERVDRRERRSMYSIALGSDADDATGRLLGLRDGNIVDEIGCVATTAGSRGSARFLVTTPAGGPYQAMMLEISSGRTLLRVDAPLPPAAPRSWFPKSATLLFGLGTIVAGTALAGIGYGAHSAGSVVAVPVVAATPSPPAPVQPARSVVAAGSASVQSFSAERNIGLGGAETVLASYLAVGDHGTVMLVDPSGVPVASAPFSRIGTVRLGIPAAYRSLPLTAQLIVRRGTSKAVSAVMVPPSSQTPPPTPSPKPSATASAPAARYVAVPAGSVALEGRAIAGHPLNLRLPEGRVPMRIELEDAGGGTISETALPAGTTRTSLQLPVTKERTTYLVALHVTRDGGEETIIKTVVASPH